MLKRLAAAEGFFFFFFIRHAKIIACTYLSTHNTFSLYRALTSNFVKTLKIWGVQRPEGRDKALAQRDKWAARQDKESRSPTDAGIKRACVAARWPHIHENCLKRLCPRAYCPFFLLFCFAHMILFFRGTSLLISFSLFPLFLSLPQTLSLLHHFFLFTFSCCFPSLQDVCGFPPGRLFMR